MIPFFSRKNIQRYKDSTGAIFRINMIPVIQFEGQMISFEVEGQSFSWKPLSIGNILTLSNETIRSVNSVLMRLFPWKQVTKKIFCLNKIVYYKFRIKKIPFEFRVEKVFEIKFGFESTWNLKSWTYYLH